jgi:hypothetical protein
MTLQLRMLSDFALFAVSRVDVRLRALHRFREEK